MNFRNSILIFGFAIPIGLFLIGLGGALAAKNKLSGMFVERAQTYQSNQNQNRMIQGLKHKTKDYKENYASIWAELLKSEVSTKVTETLKTILEGVPSNELQQTSFRLRKNTSEFASEISQPSHYVELSFKGKYRAMQRVLMEFETRLPNFQLDAMKMTPEPQSGKIDLQLKYIVWKES